jgi:hypothetical protein
MLVLFLLYYQNREEGVRTIMGMISLPMVREDLSLSDAFDLMRTARRSGLVFQTAFNAFFLYTAVEILEALDRGMDRLGEVPAREELDLPDVAMVAGRTPAPYLDYETLSYFSPRGRALMAVGVLGNNLRATLFLRDSGLLAQVEPTPKDCYCEFCKRPGTCGRTCPKDGSVIKSRAK